MAVGLYKMKKPSPMKVVGGDPVTAGMTAQTALAVAGGLGSLLSGWFGRKRARQAQARARKELAEAKERWMDLDISNPYRNLENVYEDLTVNQKQAQFMAQQGPQQRADIMQASRGAAGASGIAGLAQAMANQGQIQSQRISALIGQQEAANQRLRARGAASVQAQERYGETLSRGWEQERESTLYGMGMQQMTAANQAEAAAQAQMWGGLGQVAGGIAAHGMQAGWFSRNAAPQSVTPTGNKLPYPFERTPIPPAIDQSQGVGGIQTAGSIQNAIQSGQETIFHNGTMYNLRPDGMGGGQYVDMMGNVLQI